MNGQRCDAFVIFHVYYMISIHRFFAVIDAYDACMQFATIFIYILLHTTGMIPRDAAHTLRPVIDACADCMQFATFFIYVLLHTTGMISRVAAYA